MARDINQFQIEGNIVAAPRLKATRAGKQVLEIQVATSAHTRELNGPNVFNVLIDEPSVETVSELQVSTRVSITGSLQLRRRTLEHFVNQEGTPAFSQMCFILPAQGGVTVLQQEEPDTALSAAIENIKEETPSARRSSRRK